MGYSRYLPHFKSEDAVNANITPVQRERKQAQFVAAQRGIRCQKLSNLIWKNRQRSVFAKFTSIVMQYRFPI